MDVTIVTSKNIIQWDIFMYTCITGDPLQVIIDMKDVVIGPVSVNMRDIADGYKPKMRKR